MKRQSSVIDRATVQSLLRTDFLGCGVPTWTTDTLLAHLAEEVFEVLFDRDDIQQCAVGVEADQQIDVAARTRRVTG